MQIAKGLSGSTSAFAAKRTLRRRSVCPVWASYRRSRSWGEARQRLLCEQPYVPFTKVIRRVFWPSPRHSRNARRSTTFLINVADLETDGATIDAYHIADEYDPVTVEMLTLPVGGAKKMPLSKPPVCVIAMSYLPFATCFCSPRRRDR